jgi:predicted peptidase
MGALLMTIASLLAAEPVPDDVVQAYEDRQITYTGGPYQDEVFHYRLLKPAKLEPGKKYPLVLFMHGAGERGDDNVLQLMYLPTWLADAAMREKYNCFVLVPQCRAKRWWTIPRALRKDKDADPYDPATADIGVAEALLEKTLAEEPIDQQRIYLTGISMGGYGSWALAAKHPDRFAAVAPVCGGGSTSTAAQLKDIPLWVFHGGADPVVPPDQSRQMIEAIKQAGGNPQYTEFEGVGHDSWTPAYRESGLLEWMFEQAKK